MPVGPLVFRLDGVDPITPTEQDANTRNLRDAILALEAQIGASLTITGELKPGALSDVDQISAVVLTAIGIPVGSILGSTSSTLGGAGDGSDGWVAAMGQSVLRTGNFEALFILYNAGGLPWGNLDATHFTLPDYQDCALIGTSPGGLDGGRGTARILGAEKTLRIGAETHTMSIPELVAHTHVVTGRNLNVGTPNPPSKLIIDSDRDAAAVTEETDSTGGTTPFSVVQPSGVVRWLIKL